MNSRTGAWGERRMACRTVMAADWESWPQVLAAVAALDLAEAERARLVVCLDELFANSLSHGGTGGTLALELSVDAQCIGVVWEDGGPIFDPLDWLRRHPCGESDRVGGRGLALLAGLCEHFGHEALPAGNRLILRLRRR